MKNPVGKVGKLYVFHSFVFWVIILVFWVVLGKVGHDKVKITSGITSLKVYGDKCLKGTMVFFNLQFWRQMKTKSLRVTSKINHLEPSKLVKNK